MNYSSYGTRIITFNVVLNIIYAMLLVITIKWGWTFLISSSFNVPELSYLQALVGVILVSFVIKPKKYPTFDNMINKLTVIYGKPLLCLAATWVFYIATK